MEQWEQWFRKLESTGDADPGLALRMAEAGAVCLEALFVLEVDLPAFKESSLQQLLERMPPRANWLPRSALAR
jgi:hypothetical protein